MKKRILCYTDFSENAQNAIDYAIKLYEKQACDFYFLNAFQADEDASDIREARAVKKPHQLKHSSLN